MSRPTSWCVTKASNPWSTVASLTVEPTLESLVRKPLGWHAGRFAAQAVVLSVLLTTAQWGPASERASERPPDDPGEQGPGAKRGGAKRGGGLQMQLGDDGTDIDAPANAAPTSEDRLERIAVHLDVLRQCSASASSARPEVAAATLALARVANAGARPPAGWAPALCGKGWRPVFSASPEALKAAAAKELDGADAPLAQTHVTGRFLSFDAEQRFTADEEAAADDNKGTVENTVRLLWGAVRLSFCGGYEMSGRRMSIIFEALRVRLLFGLLRFTLSIREGKRLRGFIERRLRGMRSSGAAKRKRPNVYRWCYADEGLCVAQGSSGSVAVWEVIDVGGDGGGGGGKGAGGGAGTRGGSPRMQLSDEKVEAKLAKLRRPVAKAPEQRQGAGGLGAEVLELGIVLVPLALVALFSLEEWVRARL